MTLNKTLLKAYCSGKFLFMLLSSGILCLLLPLDASAMTSIGKITTLRGQVSGSLNDGKSSSTLKLDDPVFEKQIITTGEDGFAEIVFNDQSIFSIGRNSELILDEFIYDPSKGQGSTVFEMTHGVFRFLSGAVGKAMPNKVSYKTPTSTIGIRGSGAVIQITLSGETTVVLTHCCVDVSNGSGRVSLDDPLTFTTIATATTAPTKPNKLSEANKKSLLEEFGLKTPTQAEKDKEKKDDVQINEQDEGNSRQGKRAQELMNILGHRTPTPENTKGLTAEDGTRSTGSATGKIGIQIRIVENIQADWIRQDGSGLDINSKNFSGNETFCVFHNGAGYYNITVSGTGAGGAFMFTDKNGTTVPYTVSWESPVEKFQLSPHKASQRLSGGRDFGSDCNADNRNARLRIQIPEEYRETFKNGDFSGQTVILLETE